MLAGMGTVFVFLTALVIAMTLMAKLVSKMQPEAVTSNVTPTGGDDEIAAIAAAISAHRRK